MKYEVTYRQIEIYTFEVEAGSDDEAENIANELMESDEFRAENHNDSDAELEVYDLRD